MAKGTTSWGGKTSKTLKFWLTKYVKTWNF